MAEPNSPLSVHRFWFLVHQKNFMVLAFVFSLVWVASQYYLSNNAAVQKYGSTSPAGVSVPLVNFKFSPSSSKTDRRPASANSPAINMQTTAGWQYFSAHPTQAVVFILLALAIQLITQTAYWWGFKHGALNRTTFEKAHPKEIISLMGGIVLGTLIAMVAWGMLIGGMVVLGVAFHLGKESGVNLLYVGIVVICAVSALFLFLRWYYAAFAAMAISGKGSAIVSLKSWQTTFKELRWARVLKMLFTQIWSTVVFFIYFCIITVVVGMALGMAGAFGPPNAAQLGASMIGIWLGITGTTAIGYYLGQAYFKMFKMA